MREPAPATGMTGGLWAAAGVVVAALLGLVGVWLTNRREGRRTKVDAAQQLLATFQQERKELDERLDKAVERIERLESRERLLLDYIELLRTLVPPPPPPWPPGLVGDRPRLPGGLT